MDGKRERLLIIMAMLKLSQLDVAKATDYTSAQISKILNTQEPTNKFILAFCKAYPSVNKGYILNNEGLPLVGEDVSIYGFTTSPDTQKVSFMEQQIKDLKQQVQYLQQMLEKALLIHPELQGKLNVSLAGFGQNGQIQFILPQGDYKGGYAQS